MFKSAVNPDKNAVHEQAMRHIFPERFGKEFHKHAASSSRSKNQDEDQKLYNKNIGKVILNKYLII